MLKIQQDWITCYVINQHWISLEKFLLIETAVLPIRFPDMLFKEFRRQTIQKFKGNIHSNDSEELKELRLEKLLRI